MRIKRVQMTQIESWFVPGLLRNDSDMGLQQQNEYLVGVDEEQISDAEKEMDRYFAVSLASLGLTVAGSLFYAPLTFVALPGLLYLNAL